MLRIVALALLFVAMRTQQVAAECSPRTDYTVLHTINWDVLAQRNFTGLTSAATEYTYFVLLVRERGGLHNLDQTIAQERHFVQQVHSMNKKATFSIGGATQNITAMHLAITKNKDALIRNIVNRIRQVRYDGVTLNIEADNLAKVISSADINAFVVALRAGLNRVCRRLILGIDAAPKDINTSYKDIGHVATHFTWLGPMLYGGSGWEVDSFKQQKQREWYAKIPKGKLLAGLAVYNNVSSTLGQGGLKPRNFASMLAWAAAEGNRGVAIWSSGIYTRPFQNAVSQWWSVV